MLRIDFDSEGSKKDAIIEKLREKYGGYHHVTKVQTISTAKSKKALQIAARALGYSVEEGVFLGSFIGAERGTMYTLSQVYYGDEENGIQPNTEFVNLMNGQYNDVWKVAKEIEGLPVGVGSHAGGLILAVEDLTDNCALMKTRSGDIITQVDLHRAEDMRLIKYDCLNIDALEKIHIELDLLLEDGRIEWQGDLKSTYEKYLGTYNIERDNEKLWDLINEHKITSLFQFERQVGAQAVTIGKPRNLVDLSALNSVMRLMAPYPRAETPLERFGRFNKDITLWYKEMEQYGLTKHEMEVVKKYAEDSHGVIPSQEGFMEAVQDPEIGGFDLLWADKLRKSIAKKNPKAYLELQQEFYKNIKEKKLSDKLCHYVWDVLISMSKRYGFNSAHTLAYSIVGLQEANLAYRYPIIYWNCANLISDSGGEDGNTNYGKIATAIGNIQKEGTVVSLPDINRVRFGFRPDADNNEIVYGLKPIQGLGTSIAKAIIDNQPYTSIDDFYDKMQKYKADAPENKFGDTAMIQLIKAGCFDELENRPREEIMADFIRKISNPIVNLKMSNIEDLAALDLLTEAQRSYELRLYRFRKYVCQPKFFSKQTGKSPTTAYYRLERKFAEPFFYQHFETDMTELKDYEYDDEGFLIVKKGSLDRVFDKLTKDFKDNVLTNKENLDKINEKKFLDIWNEKASGTISRWEMESMCFYAHEHELAHVNKEQYNLRNFDELPQEPEIENTYFYKGQEMARFKICRICGTVLDRNKDKNLVTLLTPDGVVSVRFYKGQFGFYDRGISQINPDGTKTILEKSWFTRGNKLLITGFRRGEVFVPRQYKNSVYKHTVQLIDSIDENGELKLISERVGADEDE